MAGKERSNLSKKIDGWARAIFLTKEGKPKSASLLYSFALALFFVVVYVAVFTLLIPLIEKGLSGTPVWVRNCAEILIPAVLGSLPCAGMGFVSKKRPELIVQAYAWLAVFFVMTLIIMLLTAGGNTSALGMMVFALLAPFFAAIVIGGTAALLIYRKKMNERAREEKEKNRPSYYK